jgi:cytosine/adenosine deaminase-related metal-dependent hydrolase
MKKSNLTAPTRRLSPYEEIIFELMQSYGGSINGHTHPCRANTLDPKFLRHAGYDPLEAATLPLSAKQKLVGELHKGPAYSIESLTMRMTEQFEQMIANGTKEVTCLIDATTDIGLIAIEVALMLKEKFKHRLKIILGPQPIFGFKPDEPQRLELFKEAVRLTDVIGGLPEKDDSPDRAGYISHLQIIMQLGIEHGKEVHIHVDQANDPAESGTERLIEAVKYLGSPKINSYFGPTVWAVHAISPSGYDELRFKRMLDEMKRYNIGLICCPRAAITMRQIRAIKAPQHASIARLLEMIKWEIPIRLGTDNVGDIFIPTGSNHMLDEVVYLADNMRYYTAKVWAKIACGIKPNDMDRDCIARALQRENEIFRKYQKGFPLIEPR